MSDLRPTGTLINVDGEERVILFSLSAIYEVQEEFKDNIHEVMTSVMTKEPLEIMQFTSKLLEVLANDEAKREKNTEKEVQTGHFDKYISNKNTYKILNEIYREYGIDLPEVDENDPNAVSE